MSKFTRLVCAASLLLASTAQADSAAARKPASLANVKWSGAGTNYEALKGKTTVVLTYVTWCPKCNVWAPDLCSQLLEAAKDKPMAIVTVCTDTAAEPGRQYLLGKGLKGPNVFYGADAKLASAFGDEKALFSYGIIDPAGNLADTGAAGSYFEQPQGEKQYALARAFMQSKNPGSFQFIKDGMSAKLKNALWPLELGPGNQLQKELKVAEKNASAADKSLLKDSVSQYLDRELEAAQKLSTGSAPEKLEALEKSGVLASNFKTSEQGKAAKQIFNELSLDKDLKKEVAAKKAYEQALQLPASPSGAGLLKGLARRFADTHYGSLAEQAAAE